MFEKQTKTASEWVELLNTRYGKLNYTLERLKDKLVARLKVSGREHWIGEMRVSNQVGWVFDKRTEKRVGTKASQIFKRDVWSVTRAA